MTLLFASTNSRTCEKQRGWVNGESSVPAASAIPNEIHITINAEGEEDEDEYKIVPLKPDVAS